jgi:hypothetical protein
MFLEIKILIGCVVLIPYVFSAQKTPFEAIKKLSMDVL